MTLRSLSFSRQILPIAAVIGLIGAAIFIARGEPDRALVEAAETPARSTGRLADVARVAGAGIVEPSSEVVDIGSALSGLVTQVGVAPGDYVRRGQPLFSVDSRALRARIGESAAIVAEAQSGAEEARAAIAEARAGESAAAQQLALYRRITDAAAVSRSEVLRAEAELNLARERRQLAEARFAAARARIDAARATQQTAQTELARATVTAPMSGQILAVNIRAGEFVSSGGSPAGGAQPFIQMGETRPLHVRIDIDEHEAVRLQEGAAAIVSPRGAPDQQVEAAFVRVEPQIVPKRSLTNSASERVDVRVLQVIFRLPPTTRLRVGQQVDGFIPARAPASQRPGAQ